MLCEGFFLVLKEWAGALILKGAEFLRNLVRLGSTRFESLRLASASLQVGSKRFSGMFVQ